MGGAALAGIAAPAAESNTAAAQIEAMVFFILAVSYCAKMRNAADRLFVLGRNNWKY
jgi:hypothetical protein